MVKKLKVLDLFCGCGGMSKGLEESGLEIVAGIDVWKIAIESYKKNFKHLSVCEDLSQFSPEIFDKKYNIGKNKIDIIVGGPPCQGFSIAGKRDVKDPRNSLFMDYVKYLDYFQPKMFIMENGLTFLVLFLFCFRFTIPIFELYSIFYFENFYFFSIFNFILKIWTL